jgi:hypothetical protein
MECFPQDKPFYNWINANEKLYEHRFREVTIPLPTWFMARKVFWQVGPFLEERYHPEDLDFFLRFTARFETLYKVNEKLLRYRIHENQASFKMHRNLLMEYKARHFSRFVETHWKDSTFMIWGCGRDAKKFYKYLSEAAKARVTHFLEIDEKKHNLIYQGKKILPIEAVEPPFVCCVTIGKNNGIEEKLGKFEPGKDYFQLT